ncbi:MAG: hypothetical protein AB8B56_08740 [Crocinitomicaceae bacterium]
MGEKQEMKWQELIESKEFDQLSNAEKEMVLGMSNETNYRLERTLIVDAKSVYPEPEPRPLILEEEKKGIVIPLYQMIVAVAAAFVLGFFLFKSTQTLPTDERVEPIAVTDTVYVEKKVIDTVIQMKTEYVQLAAKSTRTEEVKSANDLNKPSAVLSSQTSFEADLSKVTLSNKGKSASNDETFIFIDDWVAPN